MPIAAINGLSMHYEFSGSPDLPVVIFSNSLGANLAMWDKQARALAEGFRILRYDTWGHGKSAAMTGPFSIARLAQDVIELMDTLNVSRASVCGLSMGGVVGQWLGIYAPDRLQKLVLANTAAKIGTIETWNARVETVRREGLAPIIPGTLERWFSVEFRQVSPQTVAEVRSMLEGTDAFGYAACCEAIRDADFRDDVKSIRVPTLVIAGIEDPVTTPADGQFLAAQISGAGYVELKAAHLSNLGAAEKFNSALAAFLGDV